MNSAHGLDDVRIADGGANDFHSVIIALATRTRWALYRLGLARYYTQVHPVARV